MSADTLISALDARSNFGKYLRRVENEGRSLVIQKRGVPRAVLVSIRDYLRLASPEPEVLRLLGEESVRKGTNKLTSKQIDRIVRTARARRPKRR
jgi:prevent-host-death family protein